MKHCTTDKCPQILDSSCVFYEGASLIFSGINTNDSVETVIQKLNLKLESILVFNSNNYYTKNETDLLLENYYLKSETYSKTEIDNSLATKLDKGTYTGTAQDLKNEIDGKASISHTHDISSITNLQTSLNLKEDLSNKAIDFSVVNDILYPSVKAVDYFVKSQRLEVPFANATSFTINHNLDKLCSVTISLDDGSFALCDYYNIDNNNIFVEFSTQQTGKIILI